MRYDLERVRGQLPSIQPILEQTAGIRVSGCHRGHQCRHLHLHHFGVRGLLRHFPLLHSLQRVQNIGEQDIEIAVDSAFDCVLFPVLHIREVANDPLKYSFFII